MASVLLFLTAAAAPAARRIAALVLCGVLACACTRVAVGAASAAPREVVAAFYKHHFAHDMAFTARSVRAKQAWLAPELLKLCESYFRKPASPDEVPDIEGDPFTDSQEYPKSFRLGSPTIKDVTAEVPVVLLWPEDRRTITVKLISARGAWRISDIRYGESRTFRGLLSGKE